MSRWRPSPVVVAVIAAEMIGLWTVAGLKYFYDIHLDPVDVRLNMTVFVILAAWWVDGLTR